MDKPERYRLAFLLILMGVLWSGSGAIAGDGMEFGLVGGLNFHDVRGDEGWTVNMSPLGGMTQLGFVAGGFLTKRLNEHMGMELDVLYRRKGAYRDWRIESTGRQTVGIQTTTEAIEIPLLLKVHFRSSGKVVPYLNAGPALGIHMGSTLRTKLLRSDTDVGIGETEIDLDGVSRVELSLAVGLGYEMEVGGGRLHFDLRYMHGLTSYADKVDLGPVLQALDIEDYEQDPGISLKNSAFLLMLGVAF